MARRATSQQTDHQTPRIRRFASRSAVWLFVTMAFFSTLSGPARAQGLIRDAGLEFALQMLVQPLASAANLSRGQIKVLIVNDMSLNAFVIDGRAVFVNAGLILRLQSAEELQAVMSHELAHITNGHLTRRGLNAQNARLSSSIGLALGLAAAAISGEPSAGLGLALGSASSARGVFLSHTREEESAADRSGMRFLAKSGIDPIAMSKVMELFAGQEDLLPGRQDPYLRSHPLSRDRVRAINAYAEVLGPATTDSTVATYWFERAQSKLSAYLRDPDYTFRRYPTSDTSDAARIGRALAWYKMGKADTAFAELDPLIAAHPKDAFVWELKGWIAMESNRFPAAVTAYREAASLAPREAQVMSGFGRSLLAQNTTAANAEALDILKKARARDRYDARLLRDLAMAYARNGEPAMASLHTAERYVLLGDPKSAIIHARRAEGGLPTGSPSWAKAQDIIDAATRQAN